MLSITEKGIPSRLEGDLCINQKYKEINPKLIYIFYKN